MIESKNLNYRLSYGEEVVPLNFSVPDEKHLEGGE